MSFEVKKINKLVVTSKKLTNNFAGLAANGLGPDVARGPPVLPRWCTVHILFASTWQTEADQLFYFPSFQIAVHLRKRAKVYVPVPSVKNALWWHCAF
jgi:hypothetical protein